MRPLPPFRAPYPTDALEPYLGEQAVALHFELTRGYIKRANKLIRARAAGKAGLEMTADRLTFEVAGATLHELWWLNLQPVIPGPSRSSHNLRRVLEAFGGNARTLKREIVALGMSVQGSGWVALSWDKRAHHAVTHIVKDHAYNFRRYEPLLLIDAWEHSSLLDYGGDRKTYLNEVYKLIDWAEVARRLE